METLKIVVDVPRSVALAHRSTQYGKTSFEPSAEQIAALSDDEARCLDKVMSRSWGLTATALPVTWDVVLAALREETAKLLADEAEESARVAKRKREREETVQEILALPVERLVHQSFLRGDNGKWQRSRLADDYSDDPRVRARLPEIDAEADRRNAMDLQDRISTYLKQSLNELVKDYSGGWSTTEWADEGKSLSPECTAHWQAAKALADEREAARQALEKRAQAEFVAYAIDTDELSRAAKEGYEISGAVIDHVVASLTEGFPKAISFYDESDAEKASVWQDRKAPRKTAFEMLDRVTAQVASLRKPPTVEIEVKKIQRFRANEDSSWITAIVVRIENPLTADRWVVIPAE